MKPTFAPRAKPLAPRAVVGLNRVARALASRLLSTSLEQVTLLAGDGLLIALASPDALPWVDGALYLGSDDRAPMLLMPTTQEPSVHPQLLEQALRRLPGLERGPVALLPQQNRIVSLWGAAIPARARLTAWLEAAR
jgi:hypothetical protein